MTELSRLRLVGLVSIFVVCFIAGCGGSDGGDENTRRNAQVAFDDAVAAIDQKDYTAAKNLLSEALEGGLYPDLCDDAFGYRAVCHAALGDSEAAQSDVEQMLRGGGDESFFLSVKAFVLAKQGKSAEAKVALQKAQRLNPRVRTFH